MATGGEHLLQLSNTAEAFDLIADAVTAFSASAALPAETTHDLNLVLEELVTNIFQYGYGIGKQGWIGIVMRCVDTGVHVEIEDAARPFDPLTCSLPPIAVDLDRAEAGGIGIAMVRHMTRHGAYRRANGRNFLSFDLRGPRS